MCESFYSPGAARIEALVQDVDPMRPPWDPDEAIAAMVDFYQVLGRARPSIQIVGSPVAFVEAVGGERKALAHLDFDLLAYWREVYNLDDAFLSPGIDDDPFSFLVHVVSNFPSELNPYTDKIAGRSTLSNLYFLQETNALFIARCLANRYENNHFPEIKDPHAIADFADVINSPSLFPALAPLSHELIGLAAAEAIVRAFCAGVYRWWPLQDRLLVLPLPTFHGAGFFGYHNRSGPATSWYDGTNTYAIENTIIPAHLGLAVSRDELTLEDLNQVEGRRERKELKSLLIPYLPLATQLQRFSPIRLAVGKHHDALWLMSKVRGRDPYALLIVKRNNRISHYPRSVSLADVQDPEEALALAWGTTVENYRSSSEMNYVPPTGLDR